jgi:uncharacterized protein YqgC (DUF456 family)
VDAVFLISGLIVLVGIAGTVLPVLPGVPLVLAGLALAAWRDGFNHVGPWTLAFLALLTLASFVVDVAGAAFGLKRSGASGWALAGALVGLAVGLLFGIPGLLLGPFAGAFAAEWLARRDLRRAGRAGVGAWIGLVLATALRLAVAVAMLGAFVLAWLI